MTRHPVRRPSRWEQERAAEADARRREAIARRISPDSRVPVLTTDEILAFTGEPSGPHGYVVTLNEARAHAWATGTGASWSDASGTLIVTLDEHGEIVELGPGRWRDGGGTP
jgi:hypothetical protein